MFNTPKQLKDFQDAVSNWQSAYRAIYKLVNDPDKAVVLQEPVHDAMLEQVSKILVCEVKDLLQDDWYWLEWEPTIECFYYLCGVVRTKEASKQD
jgi:hypothetical protein